jgi:2-polyprenyl-3-methyl-5-hydroxy-6-metoxy-1,4-benzoquinol methylase
VVEEECEKMTFDREEFYKNIFPKKKRRMETAWINFITQKFKKGKLLDVGCGFGGLISILREFGFHVYGFTITDFEVQECKRKGLNVIQGNASQAFPFPNNFFEGIICIEAIEQISNWKNCLSEINRVLKPNGLILIDTLNKDFYYKKCGLSKEDIKFRNKLHSKEFNVNELFSALKNLKFQNICFHNKRLYCLNWFWLKFLDFSFLNKRFEYCFVSAKKGLN